MKNKQILPASLEELKSLDDDQLYKLWDKYFTAPKRKVRKSMYRPLWYKVSCEKMGLKLEQKHITKLNRYSNDPEQHIEKSMKTKYQLKNGMEIVKTYKSQTYSVKVIDQNKFLYDGKVYKTLSAAAKGICNKKVSGYDFFGLNNKNANNDIRRGDYG